MAFFTLILIVLSAAYLINYFYENKMEQKKRKHKEFYGDLDGFDEDMD